MALVELHAAHDLIRHTVAQACLFQRPRLRVHPIHHGNVAERWPRLLATDDRLLIAGEALDFPDYELRLFLFVVALGYDDWDALAVARPQVFLYALSVGGYEAARRVEYRLRGAVVFLKRD